MSFPRTKPDVLQNSWPYMADRHMMRLGAATFIALVGVGSLMTLSARTGLVQILVLATLITLAQLIAVPAPSGDRVFLGVGMAAATPLLLGSGIGMPDLYGTSAVTAFGLAGAWIVSVARTGERRRARTRFVSEAIAMVLFVVAFFGIEYLLLGSGALLDVVILGSVAGGAMAWYLGRATANALIGLEEHQLDVRYVWLLALEDWPVALSLFASGALLGLAWPQMGGWSIAAALLPYAFTHLAFMRYDLTRTTYRQMIRALARIPEVADLTPDGHAVRTAKLATSVGRELGLNPEEVEELEYAALMHDIGRVTLNEPAIIRAGYTSDDIARWGAQIISEAPYLERAADMVRQQYAPYRQPGVEKDESLPIPSKIIKITSEYDRGVHDRGLPPIEALEQLHRGSAYEYDPSIIASLRRVLVHHGVVAA